MDHDPFIFVYHFSRSLGELPQEEKKDIKSSLSKGSLNFNISMNRICLVGMDHTFYNRIADDQRLPGCIGLNCRHSCSRIAAECVIEDRRVRRLVKINEDSRQGRPAERDRIANNLVCSAGEIHGDDQR